MTTYLAAVGSDEKNVKCVASKVLCTLEKRINTCIFLLKKHIKNRAWSSCYRYLVQGDLGEQLARAGLDKNRHGRPDHKKCKLPMIENSRDNKIWDIRWWWGWWWWCRLCSSPAWYRCVHQAVVLDEMQTRLWQTGALVVTPSRAWFRNLEWKSLKWKTSTLVSLCSRELNKKKGKTITMLIFLCLRKV